MLWGSDRDSDTLYVHPDRFGCNLHEPLEEEMA